MKYILPIILTFLINLPACGMVFSGEMNMTDHHIHDEISIVDELHSDESIITIDSWYDCCSNPAKGILERDTMPPSSIKNTSINTPIAFIFSYLNSDIENKKQYECVYRLHSPPDPSEYISLVGISVKILN